MDWWVDPSHGRRARQLAINAHKPTRPNKFPSNNESSSQPTSCHHLSAVGIRDSSHNRVMRQLRGGYTGFAYVSWVVDVFIRSFIFYVSSILSSVTYLLRIVRNTFVPSVTTHDKTVHNGDGEKICLFFGYVVIDVRQQGKYIKFEHQHSYSAPYHTNDLFRVKSKRRVIRWSWQERKADMRILIISEYIFLEVSMWL